MSTRYRDTDGDVLARDRMYPDAGGELLLERDATTVYAAATTFERGGVQAVDLVLTLDEAEELHAKLGVLLGKGGAR